MNEKPKKVYALFIASLLVASIVTFTMPLASAKGGTGSISTPAGDLDWKFRRDVTDIGKTYGCKAAPGGKIMGEHINIEMKLNKQKIFDFHIWLDYKANVYILEGPWCVKLDRTTWKKIIEKMEERLTTKLSKTTIKKLVANIGTKNLFVPIVAYLPNCENPSKYDFYARLVCSVGGIGGTVAASA